MYKRTFSDADIPVSPKHNEKYRGVTYQSITFGLGLRHIRVSHLVLGSHTLEYHTWSRVRTH